MFKNDPYRRSLSSNILQITFSKDDAKSVLLNFVLIFLRQNFYTEMLKLLPNKLWYQAAAIYICLEYELL